MDFIFPFANSYNTDCSWTVYILWCIMYSVLCIMYSVLCIMYSVLCIMYYV